jgi:DNA-binding transcriptional LysR family regulator
MQNRFEDLRTFVAVVQSRSFVAAAAQLGVAKSAVSRRVSDLEQRLNVRLLNRTTRALSLTEAGRAFFERATALLGELDDAEAAASRAGAEPTGRLRILAPSTFGHMQLMPIVTSFLERFGRVSVEVALRDGPEDLLAGGFDLAVRIGELDDSSLAARRVGPIRKVACASPSYLRRFGVPREPRDLVRHRGIVYSVVTEQDYWRFVDPRTGDEQSVQVPSRLLLDTGDAVRAAAVAGFGVAALPVFMIHKCVLAGELVPLLLPFEKAPASLYVVVPSRRLMPAKVRAFVDHLAEHCAPEPRWDRDLFGSKPPEL